MRLQAVIDDYVVKTGDHTLLTGLDHNIINSRLPCCTSIYFVATFTSSVSGASKHRAIKRVLHLGNSSPLQPCQGAAVGVRW